MKKQIYDLYINQKKTMQEVGLALGIERHTVSRLMKLYDIPKRSYRAKNTIPPKSELIELYSQGNFTLKDIGKKYQVGKKAVNKWFKIYQIPKMSGGLRQHNHIRCKPMTQEQKSLVIGTVLGDGSMSKGVHVTRLSVAHCEKQKDYLLWKKDILGDLVADYKRYDKWRWGSIMHVINTIGHKDMNKIYQMFHSHGKKVIKPDIQPHLDALAMAVWFMDDGSSKRDKKGVTYCSKLCTHGFTQEENELLRKMIYAQHGIKSNVHKAKNQDGTKIHYYLWFNKKNSVLLSNLIKPHMVPCMSYKLVHERPQRLNATLPKG